MILSIVFKYTHPSRDAPNRVRMHRKMRGVGRGGLQAMQDVAVTPEVSKSHYFLSHTSSRK